MTSRKSVDRTGRSARESRHVRIYEYVAATAAWNDLDVYARALYLEVCRRYGGPGTNNGRLIFSVRQAAHALRISKSKAAEAFAQLQTHGFLVAIEKGFFHRSMYSASRTATTWRLTEFHCDVTNNMPTKEFTRWATPERLRNSVRSTDQPVRSTDQPVRSTDQLGTETQLRSATRTRNAASGHSTVHSTDTASLPGGGPSGLGREGALPGSGAPPDIPSAQPRRVAS
jgi:hypothetical protein